MSVSTRCQIVTESRRTANHVNTFRRKTLTDTLHIESKLTKQLPDTSGGNFGARTLSSRRLFRQTVSWQPGRRLLVGRPG